MIAALPVSGRFSFDGKHYNFRWVNPWPSRHQVLTCSTGPAVEASTNRSTTPAGTPQPGQLNISEGVNVTQGADTISRARDWYDSVVVAYLRTLSDGWSPSQKSRD